MFRLDLDVGKIEIIKNLETIKVNQPDCEVRCTVACNKLSGKSRPNNDKNVHNTSCYYKTLKVMFKVISSCNNSSLIQIFLKVPEAKLGLCVASNGTYLGGVKKLSSHNIDTIERQRECFDMCRAVPAVTACHGVWNDDKRGCYAHKKEAHVKANGQANYRCWIFSKLVGNDVPNKIVVEREMLGNAFLFIKNTSLVGV